MTLSTLISQVEAEGYTLNGNLDERASSLLPNEVWTVAAVLVPTEPPVEKECVFIADYLNWKGSVGGHARLEFGVCVGPHLLHLQFLPRATNAIRKG